VVYAVGDIHGRADLLKRLVKSIDDDVSSLSPGAPPVLVFIGDYVDRGADSRGVIDQLIELEREGSYEVRALKGNHEEALLTFLGDADFGPTWAEYGGMQTLASYGVAPPSLRTDSDGWEKARQSFRQALPRQHAAFLANLELMVTYGDYAFVHAGVRPGVPLASQSPRDLLWIREDFLRARGPFGGVIVHGHTPEEAPFVGPHRIGIDTGAYATGVLTAVRLMGGERTFLQARLARDTQ
jgi:serine/threonine protein phosphatase 1